MMETFEVFTKDIFPAKADEIEIKRRIKRTLSAQNHEWATYFCENIINHPNTTEIRKIIGRLSIRILKKYHILIIQNMNKDLIYFSSFIEKLKILNQQARTISRSVIDIKSPNIDNKIDIKKLEDIFNIYYFFLNQEDSPLLMEAKRRYDTKVLKILNNDLNDENFMKIYLQERASLEEYLKYIFWFSYDSFLEKQTKYANRIPNIYCTEMKDRIYKAKRAGHFGPLK